MGRGAVAYLGFQKGGPNFRWPLVLTQRGGQTKFSNFFIMSKKNFLAKGGPWSIWPRGKYATDGEMRLTGCSDICHLTKANNSSEFIE